MDILYAFRVMMLVNLLSQACAFLIKSLADLDC